MLTVDTGIGCFCRLECCLCCVGQYSVSRHHLGCSDFLYMRYQTVSNSYLFATLLLNICYCSKRGKAKRRHRYALLNDAEEETALSMAMLQKGAVHSSV